ncbi:TetR family transcriptional regulator [Actinomadura parmotrematis]|uniref:TetR family transcriptional regulator n=1 Tax=Actinomadura parmotrematis TaxID=2864039 RepID=A0ABS7G6T7_9ACTN|nr:TetR family transcriptional regulator [Actinomadura parmotrematis]MBW8487343.1 TetR family transcriptional regulator [Actinomadura parmotrematis]
MAWDTARTKQLLLDAAVEEFAEHGPEGARVARVAARAGVNKERIYQYFGGKDRLFGAVLAAELAGLAAAVPLSAEQAGDLGDYAGRVHDYHLAHPHFSRLLAWEGLQHGAQGDGGAVAAEAERAAHYAEKVRAVAAAQDAGALTRDADAARLTYAVIALVNAWFMLPQVARLLLSAVPDPRPAGDRDALVLLVRRLTSNGTG